MLLQRLAQVSEKVAATGARNAKIALLAAVLAELEPAEIVPAIGYLVGAPRQGAVGVGWATLAGLEVPPTAEPSITVADLDRALDQVLTTTGPGSAATRSELLTALLARATAPEQAFLLRVLTGEVRQGALAGVVTAAGARAAGVPLGLLRRAAMLQGDLGQATAIALTEGAEGLAQVDLIVGRPIQPMLASSAADVAEAIDALGTVQADWKLDGARVQVHIDGDQVGIWTRNLNDVTRRLPHLVAVAQGLACTSAVLDGEVIGFHGGELDQAATTDIAPSPTPSSVADPVSPSGAGPAGEGFGPRAFQETMSAFGTEAGDEADSAVTAGLRVFFFDLMYLDGVSLIDRPLKERIISLDRVAAGLTIPRVTTDDADVATAHLDAALAQGHEGVMIKAIGSGYEAGRRGKTWRKVKPVHTLDLVVLAAEWGHGRRQGWLSNLHLGARDAETGELVMVGKTFKGLTDELLAWQTERFLELKSHESGTGHTVHLHPELVVEIAVDGAQTSTRYPGGVALRFARVRGYRPDRSPADADTLGAVRALLQR
jgi:DNA ligase-1